MSNMCFLCVYVISTTLVQVYELGKLGLKVIAYNADTLTESRKMGRKLDVEVADGEWPLVCIDPEHLKSKNWEWIMDQDCFCVSIILVSVDEAHLIYEWGEDFQVDFKHIRPFC